MFAACCFVCYRLAQEGGCTMSGLSYSGLSEEQLARNVHTFTANEDSAAAQDQSSTSTSSGQQVRSAPALAINSPAAARAGAGARAKRKGTAITHPDISPKLHALEHQSLWEVLSVSALLSFLESTQTHPIIIIGFEYTVPVYCTQRHYCSHLSKCTAQPNSVILQFNCSPIEPLLRMYVKMSQNRFWRFYQKMYS